MKEHTEVSVIIPTLNGAAFLPGLVESLWRQSLPVKEVIIVDSQSSDGSSKIACSLGAKVLEVDRGSFDHGGTRNLAAGEARGNILLFMTQDARPVSNRLVEELVEPFEDPMVALSYARQLPGDDAPLSEKYLRFSNYPPKSRIKSFEDIKTLGIQAFFCSNACAAYSGKTFYALGCFSSPVVCNEDMLFASKAILSGYKVAYAAEAQVYHSHRYNCRELFQRYFDIAASLEGETSIRSTGRVTSRGTAFFRGQLNFVLQQRKPWLLPGICCEAGARLAGFKLGARHNHLPVRLKTYLGMNKGYWLRSANTSIEGKCSI